MRKLIGKISMSTNAAQGSEGKIMIFHIYLDVRCFTSKCMAFGMSSRVSVTGNCTFGDVLPRKTLYAIGTLWE